MSDTTLARRISLPLLTLYGLGTILGAGIYVLIGEVTLRAGQFAPLSFMLSAFVAAITAYSFARLSSRIPKSAGESAYAFAAFKSKYFSAAVGLSVVVVGTISASTLVKGFAGYLTPLVPIPELIAISIVILSITVLSVWGISQSLTIAASITLLEIAGLLFVIYAAADVGKLSEFKMPSVDNVFTHGTLIFYGAFLSFYAYIGFEDIVNIAEETINAKVMVPLAIVLSLVISTVLYVALALSCAIFVPLEVFSASSAPLVAIVEYKGYDPLFMSVLSMVAIINGVLIQLIMASRILYGMADQKIFFSLFRRINKTTRTPVIATIAVATMMWILSSSFALVSLAEATSAITLIIFMVVQASLLSISLREGVENKLDVALPLLGIGLNIALLRFGFF